VNSGEWLYGMRYAVMEKGICRIESFPGVPPRPGGTEAGA